MSGRILKRMKLDQHFKERLQHHSFHLSKDVLCRSAQELIHLLGLGYLSAGKLQLQVARCSCPRPTTALELLRMSTVRYMSTSLQALDQVLQGGLPVATITEVAGPSGCGKTQFCMMLSVLATLPVSRGGLDGEVIYIDTESAFSAERLVEIAETRIPDQCREDSELLRITEKIHIINPPSCTALLHSLENLEELIISKKVRLIVLDSVASLIRKEFDNRGSKNMAARTNLLSRQAAILKRLAEDFRIPVVVTNQITTRYGNKASVGQTDLQNTTLHGMTPDGDTGYVTAALGNTWSHCVNTRLILQYLTGPFRQILIAKSPVAPFTTFVYSIQASGLVLEEDGADHYEGTDPGLQKIRVRSAILGQDAFRY